MGPEKFCIRVEDIIVPFIIINQRIIKEILKNRYNVMGKITSIMEQYDGKPHDHGRPGKYDLLAGT